MDLSDLSTSELLQELCKRKGIQLLNAGIYANYEVRGKYSKRYDEFPDSYEVLVITKH